MPSIPISQGPALREQGLPSAYQRAPGLSISDRAMAGGLDAAAQVAGQLAEREARVRADQTDTEVAAGWLQWDAENRPKFQGARAGEYQAEAEKWWKTTADRYGQALDPMSRGMASPALMRRQTATMREVAGFVGAEKEKHADQVAAAGIDTTIQFGVTSGDVAGAAQRVRELSAHVGARKGWTTEQVQAEQAKHLSALHIAQIAKLTETDPAAAQAYYDANRAGVGFAQQARVESIIKAEVDNQAAVQFAAQNAGLPYDEQLAKAGTIADPKRREKTLAAIKDAQTQVREAQMLREKQMSDKAWQLVGQGKRVPEAILASMDGKERVQLQEHLRAAAERRANLAAGKSVKTDPVFMARLLDSINDDPDGFRKLRIESLVGKMSPSDIEQIAGLQRKLREPDKEKDVATTTQLMGTYTSGWQPEKRAVFQSSMFNELDQFEREKKRPATFAEKRQIADRLMLDGEVLTGSWWRLDANKKLFEATPEERAKFAPTISSEDREALLANFKRRGVNAPTEEQIMQTYKTMKGL